MMTQICSHSKRLSIALAPWILNLAVMGSSLMNGLAQSAETISVVGTDEALPN